MHASWATVTVRWPGPTVLEALLLLLLQPLQEFVDGLLHLLLVRSGIHVFFIVRIGGRLRRRRVWNVPSSVTKTCVYHYIPGYFGFNFETSNPVKLGCLILNMHIPVW